MHLSGQLVALDHLAEWRSSFIGSLVVTNGCFDLLHKGHVAYLEAARSHGNLLLVGLNDDDSVRALKGPGRPVNPAADRAAVLLGLRSVDAVCVFHGLRATEFLRLARPDVYVKGADYSLATLDPGERQELAACNARVVFVPLIQGVSTSRTVQTIRA